MSDLDFLIRKMASLNVSDDFGSNCRVWPQFANSKQATQNAGDSEIHSLANYLKVQGKFTGAPEKYSSTDDFPDDDEFLDAQEYFMPESTHLNELNKQKCASIRTGATNGCALSIKPHCLSETAPAKHIVSTNSCDSSIEDRPFLVSSVDRPVVWPRSLSERLRQRACASENRSDPKSSLKSGQVQLIKRYMQKNDYSVDGQKCVPVNGNGMDDRRSVEGNRDEIESHRTSRVNSHYIYALCQTLTQSNNRDRKSGLAHAQQYGLAKTNTCCEACALEVYTQSLTEDVNEFGFPAKQRKQPYTLLRQSLVSKHYVKDDDPFLLCTFGSEDEYVETISIDEDVTPNPDAADESIEELGDVDPGETQEPSGAMIADFALWSRIVGLGEKQFADNVLEQGGPLAMGGWYEAVVLRIFPRASGGHVRTLVQVACQKDNVKSTILRKIRDTSKFRFISAKTMRCRNRLAYVNLSGMQPYDRGYQWVRIRCDGLEETFSSSNEVLSVLVDHGIVIKLPTSRTFVCPNELIALPVATAGVSFPPETSLKEGQWLLIRPTQQFKRDGFLPVEIWQKDNRSIACS
ncbi:uncharacterized protein LOC111267076 isoform X2 [Varroa jacobsoni]|nr:uncharacterized protein LOC111267076 isoform X2 [Varroa jacobsoni]XP_022700796.1 uncharacterized protein LOC111267076 isoform X2 [Varroa jacobsoni]